MRCYFLPKLFKSEDICNVDFENVNSPAHISTISEELAKCVIGEIL